jgi:tRNA(Ile)-lysidine synthase
LSRLRAVPNAPEQASVVHAPNPHGLERETLHAIDALGLFEPSPHLAIAVSGGADSMALALLANAWAQVRGGCVTALTVDHRLRTASGAEARQVRRWLAARGIAHRILTWDAGADVRRVGLQAQARVARYALMDAWCARAGVLHLLTAHHRADQAETFLLRLAAQSDLSGLAAMPPLREGRVVRLLRPLLEVSRTQLEAYLSAQGQNWITDPSNADPAFARVRLRALEPTLAGEGLDTAAAAGLAHRFGAIRTTLDGRIADCLARAASPHVAGFMWLDLDALRAFGDETGRLAFARVLCAVSGAAYAPRRTYLARLYGELSQPGFRGRTLGGCRVLPRAGGRILVCREPAAATGPVTARSGRQTWDGRFCLRLAARGRRKGRHITLGMIGQAGLSALRQTAPEVLETPIVRAIPAAARVALPALFDDRGLLAVPHFGYGRAGSQAATLRVAEISPLVAESLAGPRFLCPLVLAKGLP